MDAQFDRAAALLPERLRGEALYLDAESKAQAEELRLRCGLGACVRTGSRRIPLRAAVDREVIDETLERASGSSLHTVQESMRAGYLTASGGFRIGLGGTAVLKNGELYGFRQVSSLNIRIPRAWRCVTPELQARLSGKSVLILSPPGGGKTTLLRELVRLWSLDGDNVALIDERGELAALHNGAPQFDVGPNTDVLDQCPKAAALSLALRVLSPQVIAMDELGGAADAAALRQAADCGARLLASVHAAGLRELKVRGVPIELFDTAVRITCEGGRRIYQVEELSSC